MADHLTGKHWQKHQQDPKHPLGSSADMTLSMWLSIFLLHIRKEIWWHLSQHSDGLMAPSVKATNIFKNFQSLDPIQDGSWDNQPVAKQGESRHWYINKEMCYSFTTREHTGERYLCKKWETYVQLPVGRMLARRQSLLFSTSITEVRGQRHCTLVSISLTTHLFFPSTIKKMCKDACCLKLDDAAYLVNWHCPDSSLFLHSNHTLLLWDAFPPSLLPLQLTTARLPSSSSTSDSLGLPCAFKWQVGQRH